MVDSKKVLDIIRAIDNTIEENKEYLTELDNVIGDGDHGINMARGFKEVGKKLPSLEGKDIGAILKAVGITLVSTVGGASGPLYGTAFLSAGGAVGAKNKIDAEDFSKILDAFIAGIMRRGKSTTGEKTILDAIVPARDSFAEIFSKEQDFMLALKKAVESAQHGVEKTKDIIATKGRASYLGERSIGHQDPGATSVMLMLKAVLDSLEP